MSSQDPNQIKGADERFWNWIFREDDGPNNPLKVSNGEAQEQFGNMIILAGSLQQEGKKIARCEYLLVQILFLFQQTILCVLRRMAEDLLMRI